MTKEPTKHALGFLFITVLLSIVGMGIIIPVMPTLIMELTDRDVSGAAQLGSYLLFIYAVMQFFMSPILGGLSDRFGRRPVILLSLLGYAFDYLLMALAPTYAWLFIGRMLSGGFAATFATSNAYIADVSPPEKRAANFGLLGAAFGVGFIIGPVIGGVLGGIDVRLPFYVASAISTMNVVYGYFVLPETLKPENRRTFTIARANPIGSLMQVSKNNIVIGVICAYFLMQFAHQSLPAIWAYFVTEKFTWTTLEVGLSLSAVGFMAAIVQGGLTRKVIPHIGERKAVLIGMAAMITSFLGYAFLTPSWIALGFWIIIGSFGGFMMPGMQGIMSKATANNEQGELQGAIASVMSISMIISPFLMTQTFYFFTNDNAPIYFPGAPLFLGAIILCLSAVPFWLTLRHLPKHKPVTDTVVKDATKSAV